MMWYDTDTMNVLHSGESVYKEITCWVRYTVIFNRRIKTNYNNNSTIAPHNLQILEQVNNCVTPQSQQGILNQSVLKITLKLDQPISPGF